MIKLESPTIMDREHMPKSILVVADSRGRDLDHDLRKDTTLSFTVLVYPGSGLIKLLTMAELNHPESYDLIFILGGICDITQKCSRTRKVALRHDAGSTLVDNLESGLRNSLPKLRSINPNVIMATTFGVNLSTYNRDYPGPSPHPQQNDLNHSVRRVNVIPS